MIWTTRSRSHRASGPVSGTCMSTFVPCWERAGRNSPTTERVSSARSTGSVCSSMAPASSRDRSSRSTDSFRNLATCSLIVSMNSRRVASSRSSSCSSSTKPASEKMGVRSSCEAVAMNSLRAISTSRSWRCMSLKVRVSCPSSSSESTGSGSWKWPRATAAAARSTRRTRPASRRATTQPPTSAISSAAPVAQSTRSRMNETVSVTSRKSRENTATHSGFFRGRGWATMPMSSPAKLLKPLCCSSVRTDFRARSYARGKASRAPESVRGKKLRPRRSSWRPSGFSRTVRSVSRASMLSARARTCRSRSGWSESPTCSRRSVPVEAVATSSRSRRRRSSRLDSGWVTT